MNMNMSNKLVFGRRVLIRESAIGDGKEWGGFSGVMFGMYQGKVNVHVLVEITEGPNDTDDWTDHIGMLVDLKLGAIQMLSGENAGQWKLVLIGYPEGKKIAAIKILRGIKSLGLREAKDMSDNLPCTVMSNVSEEEANRGRGAFAAQQIQGFDYVRVERI